MIIKSFSRGTTAPQCTAIGRRLKLILIVTVDPHPILNDGRDVDSPDPSSGVDGASAQSSAGGIAA